MIIDCQQIAALQLFQWNNADWTSYVATVDIFVRHVTIL